ncbi:16S rRNA (adenine(1518)-N(6)/adenine(1519)-N(6))-dimethyltransferase RsmA [Actinomadura verrucosospora]|uniref:16S rRNA (adenine(1518)-N(6)/adenine(1519)-N(6))- dimethyltransferase RsmA n=1 Tax=Actinomadura verrucosospora TaxID=46165 RepID=UPI001565A1F0|nr:16S rRNA (adenine(1518)-N(6)/adenine(1519)-N(6))-dimethyltransferase RsmA [Actinomadura verrucosospora]
MGERQGLLGPADVRELAARLGIRPTKTLGQNFVIDANTVRRIVRAADLGPDDVVIEVGPGLGSLTLALLPQARRVVAVEIDPALAAELPATAAAREPELAGRLEVVRADAMKITSVPGPAPTALVANLPYNVAVPVVLHLLDVLPSLRSALVMVQAEVADRMTAGPGSKVYGVPSVKLAWYGEARRAGPVGRAVFWPVPNVDSGLVAFTRGEPPPTAASRAQVFAVVDAAFAQRRKTLRAALAGWAGSPADAERALRAADVDPRARGEALDVAAFARIAEYGPSIVGDGVPGAPAAADGRAAAPGAPAAGAPETGGGDSGGTGRRGGRRSAGQ